MRLTASADHVAAAGRLAPRDRAKSTYSGLNRLRALSSPAGAGAARAQQPFALNRRRRAPQARAAT